MRILILITLNELGIPLHHKSGFTIVELLIVIVIIGILALLVLLTYSNAQLSAGNLSRINTAKEYIKILSLYREENGHYPNKDLAGDWWCLGEEYPDILNISQPGCISIDGSSLRVSENATVNSRLKTIIKKLPTPDKKLFSYYSNSAGKVLGISFNQWNGLTVNGQAKPYRLWFQLEGENQDCKLGDVLKQVSGTDYALGAKFSYTGNGTTVCTISLPNV